MEAEVLFFFFFIFVQAQSARGGRRLLSDETLPLARSI